MGDRVSIAFRYSSCPEMPDQESVALFDHECGLRRVEHALQFVIDLKQRFTRSADAPSNPQDEQILQAHTGNLVHNLTELTSLTPLQRLRPDAAMTKYLIGIGSEMTFPRESISLRQDGSEGDNCDNGHWVIDFDHDLDDLMATVQVQVQSRY